MDATLDAKFREYRLVQGEEISDYDQILLDKEFARSLGVSLQQVVRFTTPYGLQEATVVGFTQPLSGSSVLQGGLIIVPIQTAQQWARARGKLDVIQIIADEGADQQPIIERIQAILPTGLKVQNRPFKTSSETNRRLRWNKVCDLLPRSR